MSRMYKDTKTWNPFKGCRFGCDYCIPSFQRMNKRVANCRQCQMYEPHNHPERLHKFPSEDTVFVCGNGDLAFCSRDFALQIIEAMWWDYNKRPGRTFLLQSKAPVIFHNLPKDPPPNTIIGTTIESDKDHGIGCAPPSRERYEALKELEWPRKYVTVEPIMEFNEHALRIMILDIDPERVYVGYNSKPGECPLPEPPLEKTLQFIRNLRNQGIEVIEKEMREAM